MSVLRLARAYTKRNKIIKFAGCYHGHHDSLLVKAGSGATTLMEMLIVYRRAAQILEGKDIMVVASHVGEVLTVQEQAGFQMFLARMDSEQLRLWNAPCHTPYYTK